MTPTSSLTLINLFQYQITPTQSKSSDPSFYRMSVQNLNSFGETASPLASLSASAESETNTLTDPFADEGGDPLGSSKDVGSQQNYIHIRIQQRNGRKTLTTLQGLPKGQCFLAPFVPAPRADSTLANRIRFKETPESIQEGGFIISSRQSRSIRSLTASLHFRNSPVTALSSTTRRWVKLFSFRVISGSRSPTSSRMKESPSPPSSYTGSERGHALGQDCSSFRLYSHLARIGPQFLIPFYINYMPCLCIRTCRLAPTFLQ